MLRDGALDGVPSIRYGLDTAFMDDVHVIGRNVLSRIKRTMHALPKDPRPPSAPAYEVRRYGQPHIAQQLIPLHRVPRHPYSKKRHEVRK